MHTDLHRHAYPGIGSIAIIVIGAAALAAGFAFVFFLPGMRAKIVGIAARPVSVIRHQTVSPKSTEIPTSAKQELRPDSLLARILNILDQSGNRGVTFNANIPDPSVEPSPVFSSFGSTAMPATTVMRAPPAIFISEISIADAASVQHEFVELYNPNAYAVDLANWELRKKTQAGTDSVLVSSKKFFGTIPANGYFLVAHPEYAALINADLSWSGAGYGISENNAVYLTDDQGRIADLVGYGQSISYEGAAISNPSEQASIARISQTDTGNNAADFMLAVASPHSSKVGAGFIAPMRFFPATVSPAPSPMPSSFSAPSPLFSPIPAAVSASPSPSLSSAPTPMPTPVSSPMPSVQPSVISTPALVHPMIVQVQFSIDGNANADFVQMRNAGSQPLDLSDYKLVKKTASSGAEYSLKSWKNDQQSIPAGVDFYWINSGYAEKIQELSGQGIAVFPTSATLAPTNGIALKYQDQVVSAVQW